MPVTTLADANEVVGNMKLFNNQSSSSGLLRFIKGIYWATSSFLRTPSRRGARELIRKPRPLAVNSVALLDPLRSLFFFFFQLSSHQYVLVLCYACRMMLVGVWLGLHWVLFYFFDHYIIRVKL